MIVNVFDYVEKLEKSGFSKTQAEASLQVLVDVMNQEFATKEDICELKRDIAELRTELKDEFKHGISELRFELKNDISVLENKLTIRLGGIMAAGIGFLFMMLQFLK